MLDSSFSQNLIELRKEKNLSQTGLALRLHVSRSKISSWETGRRSMTITEAIEIANFFEVKLNKLFNID